ncbi:MAG: deoxyribonuclease IV [Thermoguttaceae bacterium]|nr:deoxyribonuclease IV [Thermoguttaceae bacterium]
MPYFGVHESIANGFDAAVYKTSDLGFDCVQIFSGNSNRWANKPIAPEDAFKFKEALDETRQFDPLIHDSYLINLASPDEELLEKSVARFAEELERASVLGVPRVVTHPGAGKEDPKEVAIARVARALDRIFESLPEVSTRVLLETTAGQGSYLGGTFEELGAIIAACDHKDRLGVCFDTCHAFVAGYDFRTRETYDATFEALDAAIGLDRLEAFHLNDTAKKLGSHSDRHEHIGRGEIGLDAFAMLINDARFADKPMYLETPKKETEEGESWDSVNLRTLKSLLNQ